MPTLTPYICCAGADAAMTFYMAAFGAEEIERWRDDAGRVNHAELRLGDSRLFLADEFPDQGVLSPKSTGGYPMLLVLEVPDADYAFRHATSLGAEVSRPLTDETYGRVGKLVDPFGHHWMIIGPSAPATTIADAA